MAALEKILRTENQAPATKKSWQQPGAPITHVYFPLSGMISMLAVLKTGEAIEIAAIGREGAVGARLGRRPEIAFAQAIVQLPGAALKITVEKFQEAARNSAAIIGAVINEGNVFNQGVAPTDADGAPAILQH